MANPCLRPRTAAALLLAGLSLAGCGAGEPAASGGAPGMRRLTEDQYRNALADILGADIKVTGRFEPDLRSDGLLAVGTSQVAITRSGYESFDAIARSVTEQLFAPERRAQMVGCSPAAADTPDDACAGQFIGHYGRLLFRHTLAPEQQARWVAGAAAATKISHDFYAGLATATAGMLVAPEFLFRADDLEPDPAHPGELRLTGPARAQRLSFLLWNSTPDDTLLTAAERGDLHSPAGLKAQVDRLLGSPRAEAGVRAFFSDFLGFDAFASLAKDLQIYPAFDLQTGLDAREQTLLTVTDHLVARRGDYRDLFTTRRTFLSRPLGAIYRVRVENEKGWEPYEFAKGDPRAGLLTQLSFTALHSHPGRSSATLRGKAVRELLLCQPVPLPPNNVDFTIVQDTKNPQYRVARDRLTAHRNNDVCAGCHKVIDPIGLALENFDGAGQFRRQENGTDIDASGELDGIAFTDPVGLGQAMHDNPATTQCLARSLYRYAAGRRTEPGENDWLAWLDARFAGDGYRLPDLLRRIATSEAFYKIAPPSAPTGNVTTEAKL